MRNENRRNMLALIIIDMVATLMFVETFERWLIES